MKREGRYREVRKYVIRAKWCKTAYAFTLVSLFVAYITWLDNAFYPFFIWSLIMTVLLVLQAYYVEVYEHKDKADVT